MARAPSLPVFSVLLLISGFVFSGAAPAGEIRFGIDLDAGPVAHEFVPVSAELAAPEASWVYDTERTTLELRENGTLVPAQLETVIGKSGESTGVRVSWILESAKAGKKRSYTGLIQSAEPRGNERGFSFIDTPGRYLDCLFEGRPVYRYMYEFDPKSYHDTYKPFHHVYDFEGSDFITKGPGGKYTHHRGLVVGWRAVKAGGGSYDLWSMSDKSYQRHLRFVPALECAGNVFSRSASVVEWHTPTGEVVVREQREITAWRQPDGRFLFDITFRLEPTQGPTRLEGDLHHAGFHFRAAQEVAEHEKTTRYLFPEGCERVNDQVDGPWVVCSFVVRDKRYAVQHMNHTLNPRPTVYSTRSYGRFGAFFQSVLEPGKPLILRYRLQGESIRDEARLDTTGFSGRYNSYLHPPIVSIKRAD